MGDLYVAQCEYKANYLNNNETETSTPTNTTPKAARTASLYADDTPWVQNSAAQNNPTFGEKLHYRLFDLGLNFGVNLLVSAAFTNWVKNSHAPVWKNAPFAKKMLNSSPENAHAFLQRGIRKGIKVSDGVAGKMTDALTLTMGGNFVMIPSVWLGEKVKTRFVQAADDYHYGKDSSQNDPWLAHRHHVLATEDKPSLFGAVVGRAGSLMATQLTAMTLGDSKNIMSNIGKKYDIARLKNFRGLDHIAGRIGDVSGKTLSEISPKLSARFNRFANKHDLSFSSDQTQRWLKKHQNITRHDSGYKQAFKAKHEADIAGNVYNRALRDYSKYTALDALYTMATMVTIKPVISAVKSYIPGITYKQAEPEKAAIETRHDESAPLAVESPAKTAPDVTSGNSSKVAAEGVSITEKTAQPENSAPIQNIAQINHEGRLTQNAQQRRV
jgi:hypothetical protein